MPKEEATPEEEKIDTTELDDDGFIPLPDEAEEEEPEPGEGEVGEAAPEKAAEEKPEGEVEAEEEEPPAFKLDEPAQAETPEGEEGEVETFEIIHKGRVHKVTKDEIVNLAQKGFDYDVKVGPYGKIAKMIEADPEIAQIVEAHWQKKVQGGDKKETTTNLPALEIKPMDDYDNEADWLKANLTPVLEAAANMARNNETMTETVPQQPSPIATMLMTRDAQNYNLVMGKFPEYVEKLSVADYRRVDSDPAALCQFYDYVKEQVLKPAATTAPEKEATPKPSFKVRSGGGEAPRQGDDKNQAWNLSNDEFEKTLAKVKGYA